MAWKYDEVPQQPLQRKTNFTYWAADRGFAYVLSISYAVQKASRRKKTESCANCLEWTEGRSTICNICNVGLEKVI